MNNHVDDDIIELVEDSDSNHPQDANTWRILIVDDDEDVHNVTRFAINQNTEILNRKIAFISAYSANEAESILRHNPDIALILLDCVMETETAGLDLVGRIRDKLQLKDIRIILRTGQPGYAPESRVIAGYDINDYHSKSDLTSQRLITSITAALRSYQQLRHVYESSIIFQKIIVATNDLMTKTSLDSFSQAVAFHLSHLFTESMDCLVAVKDNNQVNVKAATAAYQALIDQAITPEVNQDISRLTKLAFENEQNIFSQKEAVLFIEAQGIELIIYLLASSDLEEYEQNLLSLISNNIRLSAKQLA